jgi:hypothetical protein
MKNIRTFILSSCCLLAMSPSVWAEPWRGIIPLRSSKTDVVGLLGEPCATALNADHEASLN